MELKNYQKEVLEDLDEYLNLLSERQDPALAFDDFWSRKGFRDISNKKKTYKGIDPHVPDVCLKVPTGGGKTFIACCALKRIFNHFPVRNKLVLWMVPSTAIYNQVIDAFNNPDHPYRHRIDLDFNGRVQFLSMDDMINANGFTRDNVEDQLTIAVITYASVRRYDQGELRAGTPNPRLSSFNNDIGSFNNVEGPTLLEVLPTMNPIIVLDESHNASSDLSRETLSKLSPSFILQLSATPGDMSNEISNVPVSKLKAEHMVKIPIYLFGRPTVGSLLTSTISYRRHLESVGEKVGWQSHPIALIQAQPRNNNDSETSDNIRKKLIKAGVPEEHIAMKLSSRDEIKGLDLSSNSCPIRYIITVNALREGWDCPNAYVLCTLAPGKSNVEVEQIVGRILRQPGAKDFPAFELNASYVFSLKDSFNETMKSIADGLVHVGFSKEDCRPGKTLEDFDIVNPHQPSDDSGSPTSDAGSITDDAGSTASDTGSVTDDPQQKVINDIHSEDIKKDLEDDNKSDLDKSGVDVDKMKDDYNKTQQHTADNGGSTAPRGKIDMKKPISKDFIEEIKDVVLPFFVYECEDVSLDNFGLEAGKKSKVKVSDKYLLSGFDVSIACNASIDLVLSDRSAVKYDVKNEGDYNLTIDAVRQRELQAYFQHFKDVNDPNDPLIKQFEDSLVKDLDEDNRYVTETIKKYVHNFIQAYSKDLDQINLFRRNQGLVVQKLRAKFSAAEKEYKEKRFVELVRNYTITCDLEHGYRFPSSMDPGNAVSTPTLDRSLYVEEKEVSGFEFDMLNTILSHDNIQWWHRIKATNPEEFYLNGYKKHYPDFVMQTKSGVIILVETKGETGKNPDSRDKVNIGELWEKCANITGRKYRYCMVFQNTTGFDNALTIDEFMRLLDSMN